MIIFEKQDIDLGEIKQAEIPFHKKIEIEFKFKNTFPKEVKIIKASTSCGCTIPEYKEKIKPNESSSILLLFNSSGYSNNTIISKKASFTFDNGDDFVLTFKLKIV